MLVVHFCAVHFWDLFWEENSVPIEMDEIQEISVLKDEFCCDECMYMIYDADMVFLTVRAHHLATKQ